MRVLKRLAIFCLLVTLASASLSARTRKGEKLLNQGREAEARKQWETALDLYEQALLEDPADAAYQIAVRRVRFQAAAGRVSAGQKLRSEGRLEEALAEFQRAYAIDPSSAIAENEIRRTREMIEREKNPGTRSATPEERGLTPAEKAAKEAEEKASRILGLPELKPMQRQITSLRMNNQPVKVLYETVGKLAGVNVIMDPEYQRPAGAGTFTIDLSNTTLEEALDFISVQTKSYWKPLSSNTIFVTNDNVQKRRDYEDYVVKVFYIKNATTVQELQEISTTIRSVTEIRRAFTYGAQNAILLRGTADQMALAEKLIQDLDKPRGEVVVDVIVMEANRTRLRNLAATFTTSGAPGINVPVLFNKGTVAPGTGSGSGSGSGDGSGSGSGNGSGSGSGGGTGNILALNQLSQLGSSSNYSIQAPAGLIQALMSDGTSRVLQQPQLRAVDNQKATLKIGDRIPYASGSFQPGVGTVGLNPLVSTQFQFLDTGVNVDLTPRVVGRNEISLHVEIDVSSKSGEVNLGGLTQPIVSRRTVAHDVRLRDGEINLLGGLLSSQETRTRTGVPFLMDIPILGRLFATETLDRPRGELLIVLVPHIVRAPDYSESNLRGVSAGNDQNVKLNYAPRPEPQGTPIPATPPAGSAAQPAPVQNQPAPPPANAPAAPAGDQAPSGPQAFLGPRLNFAGGIPESVAPNAPLTVTLQAENVRDLFTAPMRIKFDPKVLQVTSVQPGTLLTGDGQKADFSPNVQNENGEVFVNLSRSAGAPGVSGSGAVLTLNFRAVAPGKSLIQVMDANFRNLQLQPIAVGAPSVNVEVK